jgi:hypothetical protein
MSTSEVLTSATNRTTDPYPALIFEASVEWSSLVGTPDTGTSPEPVWDAMTLRRLTGSLSSLLSPHEKWMYGYPLLTLKTTEA